MLPPVSGNYSVDPYEYFRPSLADILVGSVTMPVHGKLFANVFRNRYATQPSHRFSGMTPRPSAALRNCSSTFQTMLSIRRIIKECNACDFRFSYDRIRTIGKYTQRRFLDCRICTASGGGCLLFFLPALHHHRIPWRIDDAASPAIDEL